MTLTTQSGKALPQIFYGTAWKKYKTTSLVTLALNSGFRAVDTACQPKHYLEDLVGPAVTQASVAVRADLFLQSKFTLPGNQHPRTIPYDFTAKLEDQVRQGVAKSLQNLHTEYLDAVLLHSPAQNDDITVSIINVLLEFKGNEQVRHIGISNINTMQNDLVSGTLGIPDLTNHEMLSSQFDRNDCFYIDRPAFRRSCRYFIPTGIDVNTSWGSLDRICVRHMQGESAMSRRRS